MHKHAIFLYHEDPELAALCRDTLHKSSVQVETSSYEEADRKPTPSSGHRLILLETGKEGCHTALLADLMKSDLKKTMILIGPSRLLKKGIREIEGLSHSVLNDGQEEIKSHHQAKEPYIEDFLESKLKAFIKKSYAAKKSHLYSTLLQEFERPLITLALKETNGNQIQAADILGLNRNTLRKKIHDLKISVKNIKKPE